MLCHSLNTAERLPETSETLTKRCTEGHSDLARSISGLATVLRAQGEYGEAEALHREALAMRQRLYPEGSFPDGHPELAHSLNNLGFLLNEQGNYGQAEPLFRESLEMRRRLYPEEAYPQGHPDLATGINNLAALLHSQGDYGRAEPLVRESLEMHRRLYPEEAYPQGHPSLANGINNLAFLHQAQGDYGRAEPLYRSALEMYRRLYLAFADTASEAEALNFQASLPYTRDAWLSVTRHLPSSSTAYPHFWPTRSVGTRLQRRRHLDLLASTNPATAQLADDLNQTRRELARLLFTPSDDFDTHSARLHECTERKEALERQLARTLRLQAPARTHETSPADLAARLPAGSAFVDLCRYEDIEQDPNIPGKAGERWTPRYVAFVLHGPQDSAPSDGAASVGSNPPGVAEKADYKSAATKDAIRVELGEAEPIEHAWSAWHSAIVAHHHDAHQARALADLIWTPLAEHLAGVHTLWLAPDGVLTQIPWAALPNGKPDGVLLDDLSIAFVPHGEYLLEQFEQPAPPLEGKALVVGGVDYDSAPDAVDVPAVAGLRQAVTRDVGGYLPGTKREQEVVCQLADELLGDLPIVRTRTAASVPQILADLPNVRYAHLATHGFFADPSVRSAFQIDERHFHRMSRDRHTSTARNPLVMSGLVFAGANRIGSDAAEDRGILTAEGIVGSRLEDMNLAVLSACDTGLGEVAGGEGVLGLQRAFHMAGCRTVVASLWKVDDDATCALMTIFYTKLWKEKLAPLVALRESMLHLRKHPEEIGATRGKYILVDDKGRPVEQPAPKARTGQWAAFVLSGVGITVAENAEE